MKKLIFCSSYLSVPKTITLATEDFLIITQNQGVYEFFRRIYSKEQLVYFQSYPISRRLICSYFFYEFSNKKKIKKFASTHSHSQVYFFSVSSAPSMAYAVKLLSKNNKIFYEPAVSVGYENIRFPLVSTLAVKIALYIIYGIEVSICKIANSYVFPYSDSYFDSIQSERVEIGLDHKRIRDVSIALKPEPEEHFKYIIFAGGEIETLNLGPNEYNELLENVIECIGRKFYAVKGRPGVPICSALKNAPEIIDQSVPGNILIYQYEVVIAFGSALLFEAANIGCRSVSLLDLVPSIDAKYNAEYKDFILANTVDPNTVYFPQTFEELRGILE